MRAFFFHVGHCLETSLVGNSESLALHHLVFTELFSPFRHLFKCLYLDSSVFLCFLLCFLMFALSWGACGGLAAGRIQPTAGYFCCITWLFLKPSDH